MDTQVKVYRTVKSFWVTESGIRKYCDVTINQLSPSNLCLFFRSANQSYYSGNLFSNDATKYCGKVHMDSLVYSMSMQLFNYDNELLLYGNWQLNEQSGEICIHSIIHNLIIKDIDKIKKNNLMPAA